ncbi:glycosyltransferase family 39 protein [Pontibacter pamirensis]|uniref:glycosyltransferase family 39 protein n=1 Tax=Pontibacter pamirensis TaxID=2562824 RepID=UPI00138A1402|nr:glycosyltransferase family 39 protein [Pontibacter pamirensis]
MQVASTGAVSSKLPRWPASLHGSETNHTWLAVVWALILTGISLRLYHFFDNRSFWIDEVYLSSSLIRMSFLELMTPPLDYEQKAPIGFLWLSKLAVLAFGKGEMALRLVPLVCGTALLFVFLPVARHFLRPLGVVVAVGIVALAPPLVYHAVEAKQYATEVLATAVILWLYIRYDKQLSSRSLVLWGVWGSLILWFSYSSIFVLAGMAFGICLSYAAKREWSPLIRSLIPFSMWMLSFVVNYYLFTYKHAHSEWLVYFFQHMKGFMPLPPESVTDLKWFARAIGFLQHYPLGLMWFSDAKPDSRLLDILIKLSPLSNLLMGTGLYLLFKRDRKVFMVLVFPLLLALLASSVKMYPFYDRLILFLAPLLTLVVALGCEKATGFFPSGAAWRFVLPGVLLAAPLSSSIHQVIHTDEFGGFKKAAYREALLYINDNIQEGDAVYVYWNFMYAYRFYKQVYDLQFDAIEGRDVRAASKNANDYVRKLAPDFDSITQNQRVWVVRDNRKSLAIGDFIRQPEWYYADSVKSGTLVHRRISAMGAEVDSLRLNNVSISLIDFTSKVTADAR